MTKEQENCLHSNKVYSRNSKTLFCIPPINISYWICKDCGFEGEDRNQEDSDKYFEYENTREKFGKTENLTI